MFAGRSSSQAAVTVVAGYIYCNKQPGGCSELKNLQWSLRSCTALMNMSMFWLHVGWMILLHFALQWRYSPGLDAEHVDRGGAEPASRTTEGWIFAAPRISARHALDPSARQIIGRAVQFSLQLLDDRFLCPTSWFRRLPRMWARCWRRGGTGCCSSDHTNGKFMFWIKNWCDSNEDNSFTFCGSDLVLPFCLIFPDGMLNL